MFLHLDTFEKNVLVLGGSIQAFNAVMSLKQNSDVTLVAHKTDLCSEFQSQIGLGEFGWYNRVYRPLDLKGKDMVINFDPSIKGLSKECKERGITYQNLSKNVSLEFGSTFKFGKLEIGTSTSGAAPLLEQSINDYISSIIPGFLPVAVEKMEKLTARLYEETLSSPTQVDFLNYIAQHWYLNAIARLTDSSISKLIEFYNNGNLTPSSDSVGLVWEKEEDKPAVVSKSVSETSSQSTAADSLEKEQLLRSESFSNRSSRPLVNEIKESPKKIPSVKTSVEIIDGAKAVSTVAYQFSEVSYIYPVYSENYPGENMIEWSKSRKQNVYNSSTKVINTTAHVGAGQSIAGSLSSGSKTSAVLSSAALGYLLPAMYNIVRDKQYPVFHVASNLISDELVLEHSNADIYKAVHTGFSILSSSNAQEAYDMAIVAHLAAEASHKPVLHFFDGVLVASQETSSVVANLRDVKQYSPVKTYGTTFEAISETLANVSKLLNRSYKPFEYHGSANAKVVLISMGSTGSAIKPAVDRLASVGHNVGYVNIRVFRPWSPAAFLSVIPTATEKIIVVDQANTSPVAIDVETAYYGQTNRNAPSVETVSFQKGLENIHPIFVEQYLANYLDGSLSREIIFDEQALSTEFHYKNSTSALFWDKKSTKTSKTIEIITGDFDKKHVQKYSQQMATSVVPAELNHLQFSENAFEEGNIVLQADLIMVNDLGIATGYNFALPLVANGKIFFNTSLSKEDLLESIPADVKKDLAKKSVSIYTLDANLVATNYTIFYGNPTHYLQEVLAAVFYRLSLGEGEFNATLNKQIARINQTAEKINVRETLKESIYYALKHLQNVGVVPSESAVVENATQKFVQGTVPSKSIFNEEDLEHSTEVSSRIVPNHRALLPVIFPTAFKTTQKLRPDIEGAFTVTVTENYRLTPDSYDRNVFHMELDITGTGLKYDIGDALGVYAQNDVEEVHKFLKSYGLNPQQVVYIDRPDGEGNTVTELRSIEQIFIHTLDIFGKPGKKFYQHLAVKATEDSEKEEIAAILETTEGFEKYVEDYTPTFADLLAMFPSAKLSIEELLVQIPSMKPRHYSIASSQKKHPNSVHLLIVVVDWESKDGVKRFGQATRFLVNAAIGSTISVSVKPSVMKLPPSLEAPVIMAGLGTGMAPFRAFIEERMYWKEKGKKVGPMVLYFGSRNRANEYLYGEELEAYHDDGILTHLRLAFSRDQKQKVYIQHKIQEDKDLLHDLIIKQNGSFYLCGPTWPVPDVTNALLESFVTSMSQEDADHMLEDLKHLERFVLEVY